MSSKLLQIEANPNYGSGVFRRRILLRSAGQRVIAELEDDNHAFRISMDHDGRVITGIESEFMRVPKSTCDGARDPLMALVGSPLSDSPLALCERADPRANCTHAFDLLSLALTHAKREEKQRQYDALLWDERDGEMRFVVQRNSEDFLSGVLRGGEFLSPDPFSGRNLRKGFTSWARDALDHEQLEAALVLQRAHFVSITRRILMDGLAGSRVADEPMPTGVCYSYNPGVIEESINTPDVRDYSETPEKMLAFRRSLD
jgi:hypothetical protein